MPTRLKTEETMVYGPIEGQVGQRLDWDVFNLMDPIVNLDTGKLSSDHELLTLALLTRKTK